MVKATLAGHCEIPVYQAVGSSPVKPNCREERKGCYLSTPYFAGDHLVFTLHMVALGCKGMGMNFLTQLHFLSIIVCSAA